MLDGLQWGVVAVLVLPLTTACSLWVLLLIAPEIVPRGGGRRIGHCPEATQKRLTTRGLDSLASPRGAALNQVRLSHLCDRAAAKVRSACIPQR